MQMAILEVPMSVAQQQFLAYREVVRQRHNAEDEQIMRGYRALMKGQTVIDLVATLRLGGGVGLQSRGRTLWVPRLAVMRADQRWCRVMVHEDGAVEFHRDGHPRGNERRNWFRFPAGTLGDRPQGTYSPWWSARAIVPPVPPDHRPKDALGNYLVLWEAEWQPLPPKDPALLKHIGGDLYVVCATWDLTELERAVLFGRFRGN